MTDGARPTPPSEPPPFPLFAGVLSYLIPGLGQIAQGRVGKGVMFMIILLGMFFLGQAMGNWRNVFMPPVEENQGNPIGRALVSVYNRWHFAGQFWIGIAAWPAIWQFYATPVPPAEGQPRFWHDFQRAPRNVAEEREINEFLTNSDKSPDLGWVYTVVAGMLNILVIYDAIMGPAFVFLRQPEGQAGEGAARSQPAGAGGTLS